jgi:hypothetical protein
MIPFFVGVALGAIVAGVAVGAWMSREAPPPPPPPLEQAPKAVTKLTNRERTTIL